MMDYPDFEKIVYRKPEFTSIKEDIWLWFIWSVSPLASGSNASGSIYTIPTGYRAVISDIIAGAEFMGEVKFWIPGGDNIYWAYFEPYDSKSHPYILPAVALSGEQIDVQIWNNDTIDGNYRLVMTMWRVPGSKPENPKNDDPAERFRVGDFSSADLLNLPDGEQVYLFKKRGEDKMNYLRFKDYGRKTQKKLASFHLKPEEATEILNITRTNPEKVKKVLTNFETKFKGRFL